MYSINNEIQIPSIINIGEHGGFALMATKPEYTYDNNGKIVGAVNGDRELRNCRLNIKKNKIYCDYEDDEKFLITFDVEITTIGNKNIDESTIIKSVNLYSINSENKDNKTNFIIYYEKNKDKKITKFDITANRFEFLTNDECKYIANITNSSMDKIK